MKVDRTGSVRTGTPSKRSGKSGGTAERPFSKHVTDNNESAGAVGGVAPVQSVDALLAIQEVEDPAAEQKRKRARQWGEDLLDQLDRLRLGLVTGAISRSELDRIAEMVARQREQVDDPLLTAVLDEIELRARVEIAKFRRDS